MVFFDLNVAVPRSSAQADRLVQQAVELGYDGIAWNTIVNGRPTEPCARRAPGSRPASETAVGASAAPASPSTSSAPSSSSGPPPTAWLGSSGHTGKLPLAKRDRPFQQLFRVTLDVDSQGLLHSLASGNKIVGSYDLVAARPMTEKLLQSCVQAAEVDIITLDFSRKLPFNIRKPVVSVALERGVVFEICYAPALRDAVSRRFLIANTLKLLRITRGRNVIMSSGAVEALEMRSPYDVMNLCIVFGLKPHQARNAVVTTCESVLKHGETRRTHKGVLRVIALPAGGGGGGGDDEDDDDDDDGSSGIHAQHQEPQAMDIE